MCHNTRIFTLVCYLRKGIRLENITMCHPEMFSAFWHKKILKRTKTYRHSVSSHRYLEVSQRAGCLCAVVLVHRHLDFAHAIRLDTNTRHVHLSVKEKADGRHLEDANFSEVEETTFSNPVDSENQIILENYETKKSLFTSQNVRGQYISRISWLPYVNTERESTVNPAESRSQISYLKRQTLSIAKLCFKFKHKWKEESTCTVYIQQMRVSFDEECFFFKLFKLCQRNNVY